MLLPRLVKNGKSENKNKTNKNKTQKQKTDKKHVKIKKKILKTKACDNFSSASMERAPQTYPKFF